MIYDEVMQRQTTTLGSTSPILFEHCVGSLMTLMLTELPISYMWKNCETGPGPMVCHPYPRILEVFENRLQMSLQRQHFLLNFYKDPDCWSSRSLNSRPPAQQAGAFPTELTGWQFTSLAQLNH